MNEKLSKILIIIEMIFFVFPTTFALLFSDVAMLISFVTEMDERENNRAMLFMLSLLFMATIAICFYFKLAFSFLFKGRNSGRSKKTPSFYIVEFMVLIVVLAFLVRYILALFIPIAPLLDITSMFMTMGGPMVIASLHVLLEFGLKQQLTNIFNRTRKMALVNRILL